MTSIVVTHDIEQALEISDRVALLTHGKLRFVGTPAEFRASDDPVVRAFADRRAAAEAALQLVEKDDRRDRGGAVSTEKPLPPPPPSRGKYREAWVGLFVVAGIVATVILLAVMTDAALFRGRYIVTTNVPNAGGIRKGDPVQMRGVNIGRIIGFGIGQKDVDVRLEIEGEYKIPKDSRVEVKASGLLGGMVAEVDPRGLGRDDRPGATGFPARAASASSTRWTRWPARRTRWRSRSRTCSRTRR